MLLVCYVLLYVVALCVKMRYVICVLNDYWLIDWLELLQSATEVYFDATFQA